MGRSPCCDKVGLKKGPWTPDEDQKLLAHIDKHGHGSWRALPAKAGLQRCGKSCRLRWTNYLRPDIKRGKFNLQEEQTIIQLHALLGNRWSAIATHLPKRTDNEIKNYWNTHLKKRLAKMGIDPVTHKPKNDPLLTSSSAAIAATAAHHKTAATLSHMAQWESARLEAEARLVRQSKLLHPPPLQPPAPPKTASDSRCIDILNVTWQKPAEMESPISTVSYSENVPPPAAAGETAGVGGGGLKGFGEYDEDDTSIPLDGGWTPESLKTSANEGHEHFVDGFTGLLLNNSAAAEEDAGEQSSPEKAGGGDYYEDNKNYWNSILNLVNSMPLDPPIF